MPRGSEAKLRRRHRKQEEDKAVTEMFADPDAPNDDDDNEELPMPPLLSGKKGPPVESDDDDDDEPTTPTIGGEQPMPKKKKSRSREGAVPPSSAKTGGIKTLPLLLLILMTGTTLLPAFIYAGDYLSVYLAKSNIMGNIGFQLGIGQVPKKRVTSFYEKHAPDKLDDVPHILSKYYGDYPKLIRNLERKYHDYGYFLGWEQDDAPTKLLQEYLQQVYSIWIRQWNRYAPQVLKTAARNARYNLTTVYKQLLKVWKKVIWPRLEPIFGVPGGAEQQKRKDAEAARKRREAKQKAAGGGGSQTRSRNRAFRDNDET